MTFEQNYSYFFELLIFLSVITIFSLLTFLKNNIWKDELILWTNACLQSPNKIRPHVNVGTEYGKIGQYDKAIYEYMAAIDINEHNNYAKLFFNLGVAYHYKKNY